MPSQRTVIAGGKRPYPGGTGYYHRGGPPNKRGGFDYHRGGAGGRGGNTAVRVDFTCGNNCFAFFYKFISCLAYCFAHFQC